MKNVKDLILQRFDPKDFSLSLPKFVKKHYPGAVAVKRQGYMTMQEHDTKWAIIRCLSLDAQISDPAGSQQAAWESAALKILQGK